MSNKAMTVYPQENEDDEYRYIDAGWLEAVAKGLTSGAKSIRTRPGDRFHRRNMRLVRCGISICIVLETGMTRISSMRRCGA